jgi:hypothetical protein
MEKIIEKKFEKFLKGKFMEFVYEKPGFCVCILLGTYSVVMVFVVPIILKT